MGRKRLRKETAAIAVIARHCRHRESKSFNHSGHKGTQKAVTERTWFVEPMEPTLRRSSEGSAGEKRKRNKATIKVVFLFMVVNA